MNIYRILFTIIFCFFFFFLYAGPVQAAAVANKYQGATLVPRNSTDPASAQWKQTLREMKANNINMVTYVLLYRQTDIHSNEIYVSSNNPTDASLIEGIQYAHSLGLRVQLKPHVDNDDVPKYWRGEIDPTDRAVWFSNYGKILKHVSDIAKDNNVEELCVGTELYNLTVPGPGASSMNTYYWTNLISQVRANYNGVLTYSSIFVYELDALEFWSQLDYIGISGYWQLSSDRNPSVEQLRNSWNSINASVLQPLSARYGKPIVLTEAGYRSWDCATVAPWGTATCGTAVNLNEQTNAYEALLSFWSNQPNLKGVVLWGWEADPTSGGLQDNTFTPQNKPALQVIKNWFGGLGIPLPPPDPTADVFTDNYQMDWTNWSWDTILTVVDSPNGVNGKSLKMTTTKPWGGMRLNSFVGLQTAGYDRFNFSVEASSNQSRGIWMVDSSGQQGPVLPVSNYLVSTTNGWKNYSVPLNDLGVTNKIVKDIIIQDWSGQESAVTYFDQMQFQGNPAPSPSPSPSLSPSPSPSVFPSPSPSFTPIAGTSITANPNPCYIAPNTNACAETITWSVDHPQGTVEIRVRENNGLFARAPYGSQTAPWVSEIPLHLDLYDGSTLVNSITVTGSNKKGTITASPNPCQIQTGDNTCIESITWSVGNPQGIVEVRVREANGLFARAPYGSQTAPWVSETPLHMDLYDGNSLLDTVVITGKFANSPSPSPSPSPSVSPSPSPTVQPVSGLVYDDALSIGWVNWSWDAIVDFASSIFHSGTKSVSFKSSASWAGLRLHSDTGIDTNPFAHLTFAAKANISDRPYGVLILDKDGKQIGQSLLLTNYGGSPVTDAFKVYSIPLSDFGPKGIVKDIIIQDWSGKNDSLMNIDEIKFKSN